MYRDLWARIRDDLPHKGRATDDVHGVPVIPEELEGALLSLYGHYERSFCAWEATGVGTPPVFIVVCQNTNISKLVFDWLAGYEGILLDPVYTGKAMAGLIADIRSGSIKPSETVVFLHTGGLPGLFAHAAELAAPVRQADPARRAS